MRESNADKESQKLFFETHGDKMEESIFEVVKEREVCARVQKPFLSSA